MKETSLLSIYVKVNINYFVSSSNRTTWPIISVIKGSMDLKHSHNTSHKICLFMYRLQMSVQLQKSNL